MKNKLNLMLPSLAILIASQGASHAAYSYGYAANVPGVVVVAQATVQASVAASVSLVGGRMAAMRAPAAPSGGSATASSSSSSSSSSS
ncbi:MAG TPA: hypothetical protein DIC42_04505, partial [Holosporales bacterium]|nr:hypothetical protein [Holosporales bacterium]